MNVAQIWRYPIKSMQGAAVEHCDLDLSGVIGDRRFALIDERGKLCSAKRYSKLLHATATDDGAIVDGEGARLVGDAAISAWLGHRVRLVERSPDAAVAYEMTFEPPNDDAEYYEIPAPPGSFLDLAAVHLQTTATLAHCAATRPDLDWSVRRFRPNFVLDVDGDAFVEDSWTGREVQLGEAVIRVDQPTVRCAMPLRAQPGGVARQPAMYDALEELHKNHLGVYCSVVRGGRVAVGDGVAVL